MNMNNQAEKSKKMEEYGYVFFTLELALFLSLGTPASSIKGIGVAAITAIILVVAVIAYRDIKRAPDTEEL